MTFRNLIVMLLALSVLAALPAFGQIYGPEGLNMPGAYDTPVFTNPPNINAFAGITKTGGLFLLDNTLATARYKTTINCAATGGDVVPGTYEFLFTSGPSTNYWANKWTNTTVIPNTVQSYTYHGDGGGANDSITFATGFYTVNFQDNGYGATNAAFLVTTAAPVTFSNVTRAATIYVNNPVPITITASAAPSAGENVYVRYSTDGWATSANVLATWVTNTGTAYIPGQPSGTTVSYYVYSTTATNPTSNWDLLTLNAANNGKANYSYTVTNGLILTEDFNFTGLLTSNGWASHSGTGTNAIAASSPSLNYPGYPGSYIGNSASLTTSGEDDNKTFPVNITGNSVYASFMLNVSAAGGSSVSDTCDYFFHVGGNPLGTSFYARTFIRKNSAGGFYVMGISKNNEARVYAPVNMTYNTTYFVVVKYTFVSGNSNDQVSIFINPTLGSTEPAASATTSGGTVGDISSAGIGAIALRQGSASLAPTLRIDGFRVGTTWADATPQLTVSLPTVTTGSSSSITTTTAALGGTVNPNYGSTTVAFNYGTTMGYGSSATANESPLIPLAAPVPVTGNLTGLIPNTLYHWQATATNSAGTVNGLDATFTTVPGAPTENAASPITATSFTANWTAPTGGATSYTLDVATDNAFVGMVTGYPLTGITGTSHSVTGLTAGSTYYYRIRAVGDGGTSANSGIITVLTLTNAPVATAASGVGTSGFTANWDAVTGAASYELDIATDAGFTTFVTGYQNKAEAGLFDAVTGLQANHNYYYRVRAVNASGPSVNSNDITVTLPCPTITLAPPTLLNGQVGVGYSQTVTASGGTGPYTFSLSVGVLPQGLTLASGGAITGTPTTVEAQTFTVLATDADGCTGTLQYTITVSNCPALVVTPATLPHAALSTPYVQLLSATGGVGPYGYFLTTGTLPTGVTLSSTGEFEGTPTVAGAFPITVTIHDSGNSCTQQNSFTLVVCEPIVLGTLLNATVGTAHADTVKVVSGGTAPYTFTHSGNFPAGLTLAANGAISGTPTTAAIDTFTVTVTDANGCSDTHQYIVTVACPVITLSPGTLPAGVTGTAYSQTVSATGGSPAYSYAVTVGTLPTGLALNPTTGVISGTPTAANTYNITVTATDLYGCTGNQAYSIVIGCPTITLSPATLANGVLNVAYNRTITASGGTAAYTFAVTTGTLPTGLALSTAGVLSGTPTVGGVFPITVTATDANGCTGNKAYSLTIASACVFKAAAGIDTMYWEQPSTWVVVSGTSATGVPGTRDQVILDHTYHSGPYVISVGSGKNADTITQSRPDSCAQITIGYVGNPDTITVLIPHKATTMASSVGYNLLFGDATAGNYDMIISEKGVVNVSKDNYARSVAYRSLNDSMQILQGGTWVHNTVGFNTTHRVLSRKFDGNYGNIIFDMDKSFGTFDISGGGNYYYPNLILRNTHNAPTYFWYGTGATYIKGKFTVDPGAKDSMMLGTDPFIHYGDIVNNGIMMSTTSRLVLAGTTQTISGANPLQLNGGLVLINNATVNLQTDVHLTADTVKLTGTYTYPYTASSSPTITVPAGGTLNTGASTLFIDGGYLAEGATPVNGNVSATRTVGTTLQNFGGIGFEMTPAVAPGATTVLRKTGVASVGNGNQSILRYFDVTPTVNSSLNAAVGFSYAPAELNGLTETDLMLFKSTDLGSTWGGKNATVNTTTHKLSATSVQSFSRWTAGSKNLPLFITHTITVSKLSDLDGNINTGADQTAKKWRLSLYNGYVSDSTLVQTQNLNSGVMPVGGLEAGTYIATEADSLGWLNLGSIVNGVVKPIGNSDTVTVAGGVPATVTFVNQKVASITVNKFRDTDGDAGTTADQTPMNWFVEVYRDVVGGTPVASGNTSSLVASNLLAGTYIVTEADSGASWVRINGNTTRFDTLVVSAGEDVVVSFVNFQPNHLNIYAYQDIDGFFATMLDRVKKPWSLAVHSGTSTGPVVASANTDSIVLPYLGDGTYVITEADSTGWTHLGYNLNTIGTLWTSPTNEVTVTLAAGQVANVELVNIVTTDLPSYRTFRADSISASVDNKGKVNKYVTRKPVAVDFSTMLTSPIRPNTGLVAKFSIASTGTVVDSATRTVLGSWTNAKLVTIPTGVIDSNKTIIISGRGFAGKAMKVTFTWSHAVKPTTTKGTAVVTSILRVPMPNRINVLYETMAGGGYGTTGMVIGQINTDVKNWGWFQTLKYGDVLKTLSDKGSVHTGAPHGFDFYVSTKPVLKQNKTMVASKYNNVLLPNLITLKLGIVASAMGKTPIGLGELVYDDGTGPSNELNGKMVKEISAYADSVMMGWTTDTIIKGKPAKNHHFADASLFANLNSVVWKIDSTFEGAIDTMKFADTLRLKGTRPVLGISYLHANAYAIPARIAPSIADIPQEPVTFSLNQNYPNPFNPTTTISFDVPEVAFVTLKIYNILGQEVATLLNRELVSEGTTDVMFNANKLASGVYFYRIVAETMDENGNIQTQGFTQTKKMMLVK